MGKEDRRKEIKAGKKRIEEQKDGAELNVLT
jgi:hypothetical protein